MQVKKGKKKKKKRRAGGLRKKDGDASEAGETATVYDDDKTSFMTMNAADAKQQEDFLVSLIDDIKIQPNPREFKGNLPIIDTLGITNYDKVSQMSRLVFQMREALEKFQKLWQTLDKDKIMQIIRLCLARELTCVEERKDAKEYREKRPKSFDFFDELGDMSAVKSITASSPSRANSPSPKKTNRMGDGLKTTMRDGNTTNFEIKSFGESESRNLPRMMGTFKEPPSLKMSMIKMDDRKPTAENLKGLSTARGA